MQQIALQAIVNHYCQGAISLQIAAKNPKSRANKPKTQVDNQIVKIKLLFFALLLKNLEMSRIDIFTKAESYPANET